MNKKYLTLPIAAIPGIIFYAINAHRLWFIQDDAYISYRYVANFLNGDGFVYNIGERVEGITNFGWTLFLAFIGTLGLDYIFWSQVIGFLCGAGVIVLTTLLAGRLFNNSLWMMLPSGLLVGANLSLAYWSPAGLETAAFAFLCLLSLYFYLERSHMLIASLLLAVLVRPEGALLAGILIFTEAIVERRVPMFSLKASLSALALSVPYVLFKIFYYGSLLPNPFYAKTAFAWTQIIDGLQYAGLFFAHYGFYGITLAIPLAFYKKLSRTARFILIYSLAYISYVVLVGGDVLKVHRFFLPVFGPMALLAVLTVHRIASQFKSRYHRIVPLLITLPMAALTFWLPFQTAVTFNANEKLFTRKQKSLAGLMKKSDSRMFSVATPTIGIFGYELIGHNIIDMVGLTDSTIARHSEPPIENMSTTWKEQKHNTKYLLSREPDYIVFSTGMKPSAPAERALLLYRPFLDSYRFVGWTNPFLKNYTIKALKKMRPIKGDLVPSYPVEYVQLYKKGEDLSSARRYGEALVYFDSAIAISPKPYNLYLLFEKAYCLFQLKQPLKAKPILDNILANDSLVYEAHRNLFLFELRLGNFEKADIHHRWLEKLVPWMMSEIYADGRRVVEQARRDKEAQNR